MENLPLRITFLFIFSFASLTDYYSFYSLFFVHLIYCFCGSSSSRAFAEWISHVLVPSVPCPEKDKRKNQNVFVQVVGLWSPVCSGCSSTCCPEKSIVMMITNTLCIALSCVTTSCQLEVQLFATCSFKRPRDQCGQGRMCHTCTPCIRSRNFLRHRWSLRLEIPERFQSGINEPLYFSP